jgi:hypothetical protein
VSSDPTAIPATPPEAAPAPRKKQPLRAASSIPTLDLICRVGLIALLRRGDISHMLFWAINIVLLLSFAIFSGVRVTRAEKRLGLSSTESVPEPDGVAVLLLLGLCIFGVVAGWTATFESMFWRVLFSAICGLVAFGYGGLLYACNPHLPASSEGEMQFGEDWLDENDRVLVDLETQKTSIFQRVDTYTLESTLLGHARKHAARRDLVLGVRNDRQRRESAAQSRADALVASGGAGETLFGLGSDRRDRQYFDVRRR